MKLLTLAALAYLAGFLTWYIANHLSTPRLGVDEMAVVQHDPRQWLVAAPDAQTAELLGYLARRNVYSAGDHVMYEAELMAHWLDRVFEKDVA